jgi:hypothetical protein
MTLAQAWLRQAESDFRTAQRVDNDQRQLVPKENPIVHPLFAVLDSARLELGFAGVQQPISHD